MGILEIIKLVVTLLIQFGPGLFKLAKEAHDLVESWSKKEEVLTGVKVAGAVKAARFEEIIKASAAAKNKTLTPARITLLREGVWAVNNKRKLEG